MPPGAVAFSKAMLVGVVAVEMTLGRQLPCHHDLHLGLHVVIGIMNVGFVPPWRDGFDMLLQSECCPRYNIIAILRLPTLCLLFLSSMSHISCPAWLRCHTH